MTNKDLADFLFPNINKTIADYEKEYPKRDLPENACVTRYAPSPTGFMHIGNFYQVVVDYVIATKPGQQMTCPAVFFFRPCGYNGYAVK